MPLRSQRGYAASQRSAVHTLATLASKLGIPAEDAHAALAPENDWPAMARYLFA